MNKKMIKTLLITFLCIACFTITSHCFSGDKIPLYQSKTYKECVKESGVDMSWIEIVDTKNYTHYINREVEHALVFHRYEKLIFVIKGLKEVYLICGQEYSDKTQSWQLFEVDINDNDDEFTQLYREMLKELVNRYKKPEKKCIPKDSIDIKYEIFKTNILLEDDFNSRLI